MKIRRLVKVKRWVLPKLCEYWHGGHDEFYVGQVPGARDAYECRRCRKEQTYPRLIVAEEQTP